MRIIGGTARGRTFNAPKGEETRPTGDRVKESLFGILQTRIAGAAVLDLFSGSGNLGLEAASRGAAHVHCNDMSRDCARLIEANVKKLGFDNVAVSALAAKDCLSVLARGGERFDVVFLDPPYGKGLEAEAVKKIFALGLLAEDGVIVVEYDTARPLALVPEPFDTRKYGGTGLAFVRGD